MRENFSPPGGGGGGGLLRISSDGDDRTTQGEMTIGVAVDTVGQGLFLENVIIELLIHFTP